MAALSSGYLNPLLLFAPQSEAWTRKEEKRPMPVHGQNNFLTASGTEPTPGFSQGPSLVIVNIVNLVLTPVVTLLTW
jgi:hypothetical protein